MSDYFAKATQKLAKTGTAWLPASRCNWLSRRRIASGRRRTFDSRPCVTGNPNSAEQKPGALKEKPSALKEKPSAA
jgi:hypothetical protein